MTKREQVLRELRWFKIALGVIGAAIFLVVIGQPIGDVLGLTMAVLVIWVAWSMASGLYPWSMRR